MVMLAPVCGFRPVRSPRSLTENVPKPIRERLPPFASSEVIASVVAFRAFSASAFVMSAAAAIAATNSGFFHRYSPLVYRELAPRKLDSGFGLVINERA